MTDLDVLCNFFIKLKTNQLILQINSNVIMIQIQIITSAYKAEGGYVFTSVCLSVKTQNVISGFLGNLT